MTRTLRQRCAMTATAILLAACSDSSGPDGDARVSVLLTDAPGDVKAAVVTISEVYLQGDANGKVTLSNTPFTVDLTDLANSTADLVNDVAVESGTYSELRFVVTGGYIEVENQDGSTSIYSSSPTYSGLPSGANVAGTLQMPSLGQSGLKVDFASDIEIEGETELLVDFDVAESFGHQAGQSGQWVMHPVIKGANMIEAATVTANLELASGITLPSGVNLGQFKAQLGNEEIAFTDVDGDGTFTAEFKFLMPGEYEVTIVAPAGLAITTNPTLPADVEVDAGEEVDVDFTILTVIVN